MSNSVIDDQGVLTRDATIDGVHLTKGMTAAQREEAVVKASAAGKRTIQTGLGPPAEFQTAETAKYIAERDAVTQTPEHKALNVAYRAALDKLQGEKSSLAEGQYDARVRDLRREYENQLNGIFAAHMRAIKAPPPSAK